MDDLACLAVGSSEIIVSVWQMSAPKRHDEHL